MTMSNGCRGRVLILQTRHCPTKFPASGKRIGVLRRGQRPEAGRSSYAQTWSMPKVEPYRFNAYESGTDLFLMNVAGRKMELREFGKVQILR
jgi:hypothetical protein